MLPLFISQVTLAQSTQSITNPTSVLSIFLSLLLVVGIIFALAYVMRRFNVTTSGNNQLRVVASMVTGAKEKIMVIEVGDEQHLIGVTSHTISHLSKLDTKLSVATKGEKDTTAVHGQGEVFKQKLVSAMAGKLNPQLNKESQKEESSNA